jgi:hypothetical protein
LFSTDRNQPNVDARFDEVLAQKLPVDSRLRLTSLEQADGDGIKPVLV